MKITAVLMLGLAIAALLRRQPAALRHWALTCAILGAAVTPLLSVILPAWQIAPTRVTIDRFADRSTSMRPTVSPAPGSVDRPGADAGLAVASTDPDHGRSFSRWLTVAWIAGAMLGFAVVIVGFVRLSWLASRARPIGAGPWREAADQLAAEVRLPRTVTLLQSDHPSLLVTWGTRRPKIILPAAAGSWPLERIRIVLRHELAHVQRRDWAMQVAAELLKAAYWFNPAVWIVTHRLRLESEHACDDAVMNSGIEAADYASHLVGLARALNQQPRTWLPAPAIARPSSLHRRVSAMLNTQLNRRPIPRSLRIIVSGVLLATTVALAAAQAPFATVTGTVSDPRGGIIQGVTLTLSQVQTQAKHEVKSDATGHFEMVGLPAGDYVLETKYMGFANTRDSFSLSAGQIMPKSIMLQVGTLQETITVTESPSSSTVAPRRQAATVAPKPCTVSAAGGRLVPPLKVLDVKPRYPLNLRGSGTGGRVDMEATIGTDGTVTMVNVVTSPQPDLADAAVEAVRQWRFTPTLLNCTATPVNMQVAVSFQPEH